jgi:hypothetical protein
MHGRPHCRGLGVLFAAVTAAPLALLAAQPPQAPQGPPAPPTPPPKVAFVLKDRHGHATPASTHAAHTGGGGTDVAQPRDDTVIITLTGVTTAGPHPFQSTAASLDFDMNQAFEIVFNDPKVTKARLTSEAHLIGLLRGDRYGGSASAGDGTAVVTSGGGPILGLAIEGHTVDCDANLAVNDHKGPDSVPVLPGDYHLLQTFRLHAAHLQGICGKAAAAEFAPDPALDPTWITVTDPFRGANKKEFGFRVILRVEPE